MRIMLLTFQDRLRIPWCGGTKHISMEAFLPLLILPLVLGIAAINIKTAIIMGAVATGFIALVHIYLRATLTRTRFFFMMLFWTIVFLITLFQVTVPMMEVLPEENFAMVLFTLGSLLCLYRTKTRARLNHLRQSEVSEDEFPDITEEKTSVQVDNDESDDACDEPTRICPNCRRYVQPRVIHCFICQACIDSHQHHSLWLDCCIGEHNYRDYFFLLGLSQMSLFYGTNIAITAVCHPVLITRVFGVSILMPDDCSDVFDDYETSITFIIATFAFIIGSLLFFEMILQMFLISKGITYAEWKSKKYGKRKNIFINWKNFMF